jgi:hypothetical protein
MLILFRRKFYIAFIFIATMNEVETFLDGIRYVDMYEI